VNDENGLLPEKSACRAFKFMICVGDECGQKFYLVPSLPTIVGLAAENDRMPTGSWQDNSRRFESFYAFLFNK
jgi:hypothetical protein